VCIILVIFSLVFVSCSGGTSEEPDDTVQTGDAATDAVGLDDPSPAVSQYSGEELIEKIVFLGDSTTYGLKHYELLPGGSQTTQVWTPSSGTLALFNQSIATIVYPETGEEISIVDAATAKKPEILLITLGINGIATMEQDYFISEYTNLVNKILDVSPDTKIVLNTMYPVASDYEHIREISNEKIVAGNLWIAQVAQDTGAVFLNTYEAIADADGTLPDEYQNGDGIHLNPEGFNVVLDYIKTHADSIAA